MHFFRLAPPAILGMVIAFSSAPGMAAGDGGPPSDLAARFRDPPRDRRILQIIHNFPETAAQSGEMVRRLLARGFGGVVANVNTSDYLKSEARWDQFRSGVEAARAAGMTVWLYDEEGYPSAAAGGLTLEGHPEWEARGLLCAVAEGEGRTELTLPEGDLLLLRAHPVREGVGILSEGIDLRGELGRDRRVRLERPGRWRISVFVEARLREGTHAEGNLFRKRPYPNLLEPGPMERFVALTHGAYAERFRPLGASFEAVFTDEPSLQSVFLREMPFPALPWSKGLAKSFLARKGYDLLDVLPALVTDFGPAGRRARCDFWDLVGSEVAGNYFGRIQDWCRAHGIASTGHLLAEEDLGSHVGFYGNFYACAARLDIPGIDCLTSDPPGVPWHIAKLLGSVACRFGRTKAMSETSDHAQRWRPPGDARPAREVSAAEVLGTAHLLYSAGINTTTSYYSWAGRSDEEVKAVNEEIGRTGVVLEGGEHVSDIALLYPVESVWARFVPQRSWARSPEVSAIDEVYRDACTLLFRARRDFDIIDSQALAAAGEEGGALRLGTERYRILVLPATDVLPIAALRKAADLARAGGTVVALGGLPVNTPDAFPSAEAMALAAEIFGGPALAGDHAEGEMDVRRQPSGGLGIRLPERSGWLLSRILDLCLEPDLSAPARSPLRYAHRRKEGRHFYFLINDSAAPWSGEVHALGEGSADIWDPRSGEIRPIVAMAGGGWTASLPPYGAVFLSFGGAREPLPGPGRDRIEGLVTAEPLESLVKAGGGPQTRPVLSLGPAPHVDARISPLDPKAAPLPARIAARLSKGGIDSWCFAILRFPEPADFSRFEALEISTRVEPKGRGAPARLVVLLHEDGGDGPTRDYLADARRSLDERGARRSAIPFDSFQLAGWSRDPDGKLDLEKIRDICIGWGGYTAGHEGEEIDFDLEGINLLRASASH